MTYVITYVMTYLMTYGFRPFYVTDVDDMSLLYVPAVSNENHMSLDMPLCFMPWKLSLHVNMCFETCRRHDISKVDISSRQNSMTYPDDIWYVMVICHGGRGNKGFVVFFFQFPLSSIFFSEKTEESLIILICIKHFVRETSLSSSISLPALLNLNAMVE